jgi:hypothetical protein
VLSPSINDQRRHDLPVARLRPVLENDEIFVHDVPANHRITEILRRIERAISRWRKTGSAIGMTAHELDQFADAFEHPEREAARKAAKR